MLSAVHRRGFTMVELALVVALLAVAAGIAVPFYRSYLIRNDLSITTEQTVQALGRAQLLAQSGQEAAAWGFHAPTGTLYKGATYAGRDASLDEAYPVPPTIAVTGLTDVSFARLTGRPSQTGTIVLTALSGEQRTVNIRISAEGLIVNDDDKLTICHKPGEPSCGTKELPESAWPAHQGHGDTIGACTEAQCPGEE